MDRVLLSDLSAGSYGDSNGFTSYADGFYDDPRDDPSSLNLGDRICPPSNAATAGTIRAVLAGAVLLVGGLAIGNDGLIRQWLAQREQAAEVPQTPLQSAAMTPAASVALPAQPLPEAEVAPPPGATAGEPAATTAAAEPSAAAPEAALPEPLPPPQADPSKPYQKRALAAGLHPDLSRALLESLTPADFRNAAHAVATALRETPDDTVFVWPRDRQPKLALYQVHFVRGAGPQCRRYVVTVTKDGWSTTAPPMERCGAARQAAANPRSGVTRQ